MRRDLFINGIWKEAEEYAVLRSPYSGDAIAEVAQAGAPETDDAIAAAAAATGLMARMPAHERASILERMAAGIERRKEECARTVAMEAAKPIRTARGEIDRTIQTYRFAAMEAKRIHGETVPLDAAPGGEGRVAYTMRTPLGVVGAITPFNFPFNLVAHKVGPALAAGNTVVLKPASQTPLSSLLLGEIAQEVGLPPGALNIIPGKGSVVGEMMVRDPRVKAITFTGSPEVGIALRNKSGLKRVTLELGSNSALIIDDSAEITQELINRCVTGSFSFSGQMCISIQRIYVHESRYELFVSEFKAASERLLIGDPLAETTDLSAMISQKEVGRIQEWVTNAVKRGAQIVTGGQAVSARMYPPTILMNVPSDEPVSCQEAFGPVVCLSSFASLKQAIEEVNRSRYGLQAGIYTNNLHAAMTAAEQLEVGGVMINDIPTFRVDHMPYGGVKDSGIGREGVKYAVEELTELKLVVIKTRP